MLKKFVAAALLGFVAFFANGQEMAPDVLIKQVTEEVLEIVRKDKDIQNGNTRKIIELAEAKVLPHFNFQRMTSLAVGKDWRKATAPQKQQLAHEFKTMLVRTYANALSGYKNQKVVFKPFKMNPADEQVLVRSEIQQPGSKAIELDYALEKIDNAWKVFDVSVSGISLVTNYREQFAAEVRNGGIEGLLETLVAKNKSLEATLAAKSEKK